MKNLPNTKVLLPAQFGTVTQQDNRELEISGAK